MILVTAANGNQGKLLVPKLLAARHSIRACVRSDSSARTLRAVGVADVVVGDMTDPAVLSRAMRGVEKVYHVGPTLDPKEREQGFAAIDAACAAGVRHFVFSSVLHAITTDLMQHKIKRDIEEYLLSSGLEFTILQPTNYMLPIRLKPVFEKGIFYLTSALDRHQSLVDLEDVTEVVAAVLTNSEHHTGATYELVGPGRHTAYDLAKIIGEVLGREIPATRIDPDMFIKQYLGVDNLGASSYQVQAARAISARYSSHDFVGNPNVLAWLLGRKPTTYREFVQRQFDVFRAAQDVSLPPAH